MRDPGRCSAVMLVAASLVTCERAPEDDLPIAETPPTWHCAPQSMAALREALGAAPFHMDDITEHAVGTRKKIVARRRYQPSALLDGYREILTIALDVAADQKVRPQVTLLLSKQALGDRSDYRGATPAEHAAYVERLQALAEGQGCRTE